MANQFLSLSLFLMLLSFFIVMNSVSSYEEAKSKPILNSLALAFTNETQETERAPELTETPRSAILQGDTLEEIEGLFDGHIENFEATRNRLGTIMHVKTPVTQFENAINIDNSYVIDEDESDKGAFLKTMVSVLRAKNGGKPYSIDILLNLENNPINVQKNTPEEFKTALRRVSVLNESLEKTGLPRKMVSAGLNKGKAGFIDIFFYPYKPMELPEEILPKQNKQEEGEQ